MNQSKVLILLLLTGLASVMPVQAADVFWRVNAPGDYLR
jgi:hypothetical protein